VVSVVVYLTLVVPGLRCFWLHQILIYLMDAPLLLGSLILNLCRRCWCSHLLANKKKSNKTGKWTATNLLQVTGGRSSVGYPKKIWDKSSRIAICGGFV